MPNPHTQMNFPQGQERNPQGQKQNIGSIYEEQSIPQAQTLLPQGLEQNTEGDILPEKKSICQVSDYLSSPQSLKMNLNTEKKMELIEKNSFFPVVLTKSINEVLKKEFKEEEKVAHSFNMNLNRFKSH